MEFFKVFPETLDGILFFLQKCWDIDIPTNGLAIKTTRKEVACGVVLTPCCAAHHTPMTLFEQRNKLVSSYILISYLTVVNRGLAEICLNQVYFSTEARFDCKISAHNMHNKYSTGTGHLLHWLGRPQWHF